MTANFTWNLVNPLDFIWSFSKTQSVLVTYRKQDYPPMPPKKAAEEQKPALLGRLGTNLKVKLY